MSFKNTYFHAIIDTTDKIYNIFIHNSTNIVKKLTINIKH